MKKIQIIMLSLLMLVSNIGVVKATGSGWTVSTIGEFTTEVTAEKSGSYSYDGDYSMSFINNEASLDTTRYLEVSNTLSENVTAGKYTLKFYVRKSRWSEEPDVVIGDTKISCSEITPAAATAPSGGTGWKEYTTEIHYSGSEASSLSFRIYWCTPTYYIDNVSLVKEGTDVNLVTDSGFEETQTTPEPEPDNPDPAPEPDEPDPTPEPDNPEPDDVIISDLQPTNVMLTPGNKFFGINWINPASSNISKITVYDITSGEDVFITDEISTTASERIYYKITGLTNNEIYQYKIVFSFNNHSDYVHYIGGQLVSHPTKIGDNWKVEVNRNGAAGYTPVEFFIDESEAAEGKASLKLISNIDWEQTQFKSEIYFHLNQSLPIVEGKVYKVSFKIKGENVGKSIASHMAWSTFDGMSHGVANTTGTYDWTLKEFTYSKGTSQKFSLLIDGLCGALWIDDMQCYLLDDNNQPTGDNLFKDGGFENLLTADKTSVSEFNAEAGIGSIKLSWKKPSNNYSGANIYQEYNGEKLFIGKLSSKVQELKLNNLEEDEEYTIYVAPLNSDGVEGEAYQATVKTLIPDYVISNLILKKGTQETAKLLGAGDYTVTLKARNNTVKAGINCEAIVAVYDGNTLVKVYSSEAFVPQEKKRDNEITVPFTIPEGENYSVTVFVVDTRESFEYYYTPVYYGS